MCDVVYFVGLRAALPHRMLIFLSLLICIVGCLVYALSTNAKVAELGRLAFACGLLAFLLVVKSDSFRLL